MRFNARHRAAGKANGKGKRICMTWRGGRVTGFLACGLGAAMLAAATPAAAGAALVFDAATGRVIYEEDATRSWQPASLTKLMTAYVVFNALKEGRYALNTEIGISPRAFVQPPTRFGLAVGKTVAIDLALRALIIKSANDFAVALAEATSGSVEDFVDEMNATAHRLGMTSTHFINPNGLPLLVPAPQPEVVTVADKSQQLPSEDGKPAAASVKPSSDAETGSARAKTAGEAQPGGGAEKAVSPPEPILISAPASEQARTSARDMGLLAEAISRDFPEFFPMFSEAEVEIGRRKAVTHNDLLKGFDGADGMKTGFTCGAGYNIVASATRNGRRLIAVVLGEPTGIARTARAEHLIDHGFEVVEWKLLFDGPIVATLPLQPDEGVPPDMAAKQFVAKCSGGGRGADGHTTLRSVKARAARRLAKK